MIKLKILQYNPAWPRLYAQQALVIREALGEDLREVHHVGSTSVPGLMAKPKIDIIAEVNDLGFDYSGLEALAYVYRGGFNLPFRRSFSLRSQALDVNLHVFEAGDAEVELNLTFRDYLRSNEQACKEYAQLKQSLVLDWDLRKEEGMLKRYTLGKHNWITSVLRAEGYDTLRMVIASHYSEMEALMRYRAVHYNSLSAKDLIDLKDNAHQHFIFYKGVDIIGYSDVEITSDAQAIIRVFVVDDLINKKDCLVLTQKWISLEGYRDIT